MRSDVVSDSRQGLRHLGRQVGWHVHECVHRQGCAVPRHCVPPPHPGGEVKPRAGRAVAGHRVQSLSYCFSVQVLLQILNHFRRVWYWSRYYSEYTSPSIRALSVRRAPGWRPASAWPANSDDTPASARRPGPSCATSSGTRPGWTRTPRVHVGTVSPTLSSADSKRQCPARTSGEASGPGHFHPCPPVDVKIFAIKLPVHSFVTSSVWATLSATVLWQRGNGVWQGAWVHRCGALETAVGRFPQICLF